MNYTMEAETGIVGLEMDFTPERRKAACEEEIKAILKKYGCVMIVGVKPQEEN